MFAHLLGAAADCCAVAGHLPFPGQRSAPVAAALEIGFLAPARVVFVRLILIGLHHFLFPARASVPVRMIYPLTVGAGPFAFFYHRIRFDARCLSVVDLLIAGSACLVAAVRLAS